MPITRKHGRIAFTPSPASRAYFEELVRRLTRQRGLEVRVTQREAFDQMVKDARRGAAAQAPAEIRSPAAANKPPLISLSSPLRAQTAGKERDGGK